MIGAGKAEKICGFIEEAKFHGATSCPGSKYEVKYKLVDSENIGVRLFPESEHEAKICRNNGVKKNHSVAPCDY